MLLDFQTIEHEWQWAEAARISTIYFPEDPVTGEKLKEYASEYPADYFHRRSLCMQGDAAMGYIRMMQTFWYTDQTKCHFGIAVERTEEDARIYRACLDHVIQTAGEAGLKSVMAIMRADDPHLIKILTADGFEPGQVNSVSSLEVPAFDIGPYAAHVAKAQEMGYEIVNLRELSERTPDNWCRALYDWEMKIMEDVPMAGTHEPMEFEVFEKMCLSPTLSREGYILALTGDEIAACTQLNWNDLDRTIANTGVTGVRREHRRQGLATALKALSVDWAKGVGIQRIYTDNEVNNPMYQLNLALGYKHLRDIVDYAKVIA